MRRIVVLIDGTWNKEGTTNDTNVAKLDSANRAAERRFIKVEATGAIIQKVHCHDGVGTQGDAFKTLLGGAIGAGSSKSSWIVRLSRRYRHFAVTLMGARTN
jgi:hypothetical protein